MDYAIYILLGSRIVRRSGPIGSTTIIITSTAGVYAGIVAIRGMTYPATSTSWIAIIPIALISTVLAFVTFFAGLKRIGPTGASTLSTFEPIVAVVLAAIVLGETISPYQVFGGILILAAVVLHGIIFPLQCFEFDIASNGRVEFDLDTKFAHGIDVAI